MAVSDRRSKSRCTSPRRFESCPLRSTIPLQDQAQPPALTLLTYNQSRQCTSEGFPVNTKLTLRLDDELIRSAKRYAGRSGKSVSRLVADYCGLHRRKRASRTHRDLYRLADL